MKLIDGCHSLKLECALRNLGFVDIKWRCVANAGIFFVVPVGIPDNSRRRLTWISDNTF